VNRVELFEPEVGACTATFRWSVEPATTLYQRRSFELRFPDTIDLARVPKALWWRLALLCLHAHWALLRPCRVKIPVRLPNGEKELWNRLVDSAVQTLEACRGGRETARAVEILEGDAPLPPWEPLAPGVRCGAAFSGGKDSLLHAGLLSELTGNPVLVTTTSPMPPLHDHETPRRRQVLSEMARRRAVTLVEVRSDFRSAWDNHFADRLGYPVAVNELTDTHLYLAALLAAGTALGVTHFFLASENEVQENVARDGRVVQHTHFMYSAVTQRSVQALIAPAGLVYSSLTTPLHSEQVQHLLWRRYPDLCDLQYSCWRVGPEEATCSRCKQCFRLALGALRAGGSPSRMGIDLARLLVAMGSWRPPDFASRPGLPGDLVGRRLHAQTVRAVRALSTPHMAAALARSRPFALATPRGLHALASYWRVRRRTRRLSVGDAPGYQAGFVRLVDPLLADRVAAIYSASFPAQEESEYRDVLARGDALTRWIVEPIGGETHA
jgi:hypothetical protein